VKEKREGKRAVLQAQPVREQNRQIYPAMREPESKQKLATCTDSGRQMDEICPN
jgi:hypothetical protein